MEIKIKNSFSGIAGKLSQKDLKLTGFLLSMGKPIKENHISIIMY